MWPKELNADESFTHSELDVPAIGVLLKSLKLPTSEPSVVLASGAECLLDTQAASMWQPNAGRQRVGNEDTTPV